MGPHRYLSLNPSSVRSRFAKRFLVALAKINRKTSSTSSSSSRSARRETAHRCLRVKAAADRSLALAVGPRRAWSRALLYKIRSRSIRRRSRNTTTTSSFVVGKRISRQQAIAKRRNNRNSGLKVERETGGDGDGDVLGQADELRKLVPGGEGMDTCRLLGEVAHYMQCLKAQVQVMRCVADYYSSN